MSIHYGGPSEFCTLAFFFSKFIWCFHKNLRRWKRKRNCMRRRECMTARVTCSAVFYSLVFLFFFFCFHLCRNWRRWKRKRKCVRRQACMTVTVRRMKTPRRYDKWPPGGAWLGTFFTLWPWTVVWCLQAVGYQHLCWDFYPTAIHGSSGLPSRPLFIAKHGCSDNGYCHLVRAKSL